MFLQFVTSLTIFLSVEAVSTPNLSRKTRQADSSGSDGGCQLPDFPSNGLYAVVDSKELRPGDRVGLYTLLTYSCLKGFEISEGSSLCQEDGTWSATPECIFKNNTVEGCPLPHFPTNGWYTILEYDKIMVPGDIVGVYSVLEYSCENNFGLTVPNSLCQDDGTWSSSPECKIQAATGFECIESGADVKCSLPQFPPNGRYTILEYDKKIVPGDPVALYTVLQYSCEKNFDPTEMISVCQDDQSWNSSPECRPAKFQSNESEGCPLPNFPTNGWYIVPEYNKEVVPGDRVPLYTALTYFCKADFDLTASNSLCLDDKTWSSSPKCNVRAASPRPSQSAGSGCPLPDFPYKGRYSVTSYDRHDKIGFGDIVEPDTILQYSCDKNYDLTDKFTQCQADGTWNVLPECTNRCKMVTSFTVDFTCFTPAGAVTTCSKKMSRGSTVRSRCKPGHFPTDVLGALVCEDRGWNNPIPKCKPDCGLETSLGVTHIINGVIAKKNTFPWHVAIYRDNGGQDLEQICGGSLIQSHIVVSAAHCFYNALRNAPFAARYYRVSGGNFYRSWSHELERGLQSIQKSGVLKIRLHDRYGGDLQLHQSDVALLVLSTPFKISDSVRPVCYDLFYEDNDSFQVTAGNLGKVAGWGLTSEQGSPSEELKTLTLPIIGYRDCLLELSKYHFSGYLTTDKFCAGYLNGSAVCRGDSGGGLVFPVQEVTQTRWYLRGVVSNGPLNEEKNGCRAESYTVFTHLFKLRDWINQELWELMQTNY